MIKERDNLLSIGELSRISGISIKCLRYYDRIGALKPVYINPDSGYRYYTAAQLYAAEAVRICIELDIPLKELERFACADGTIDLAALLCRGKQAAQQKIKAIQDGLSCIEATRREIEWAEAAGERTGEYRRKLPQRQFFVMPCRQRGGAACNRSSLGELMEAGRRRGLAPLCGCGLLCRGAPEAMDRYLYMEIVPQGQEGPEFMDIPAGTYRCMRTGASRPEEAVRLFPDLPGGEVLIVEKEMLTRCMRSRSPLRELQLLPLSEVE